MANISSSFSNTETLLSAYGNMDLAGGDLFNIDVEGSGWEDQSVSSSKISLVNTSQSSITLKGNFASFPAKITSMDYQNPNGLGFSATGNLSLSSTGAISGSIQSASIKNGASKILVKGSLQLSSSQSSQLTDVEIAANGVNLSFSGAFSLANGSYTGATLESISVAYKKQKLTITDINLDVLSHFNDDAYQFGASFVADLFSGDDLITGGKQNDFLAGLAGNDEIDGKQGVDTADYSDKSKSVSVTLNTSSNATVYVDGAAEDTLRNIENIDGGSASDTLTGDSLSNSLNGEAGDDLLKGQSGKDFLDGGAGMDTADFSDKYQTVSLTLTGSIKATAKVNGRAEDTVVNVENIIGGSGDDALKGDAYVNTLKGGSGWDVLDGAEGDDVLNGGAGSDTYVVTLSKSGNDTLIETDGAADTLQIIGTTSGLDIALTRSDASLAMAFSLSGTVTNTLTFKDDDGKVATSTGIETFFFKDAKLSLAAVFDGNGSDANEILIGNETANKLLGQGGADFLFGSAGDDELRGGSGLDALTGGLGSDQFVFDTAPNSKTNVDRITDFDTSTDKVVLDDAIFTRLTGFDFSTNFIAASKAKDANDYLIYNAKTLLLSYDEDGSGKAAAVAIAKVELLGHSVTFDTLDFVIA